MRYLNRLSDWLFVAARVANDGGAGDVLWVPGREPLTRGGRIGTVTNRSLAAFLFRRDLCLDIHEGGRGSDPARGVANDVHAAARADDLQPGRAP